MDNPASSCLSCHSTAQVDTANSVSSGSLNGFLGVQMFGGASRRIAPSGCSTVEQMMWFRNVPAGDAWGGQSGCTVNPGPKPNLVGVDYSLQIVVGLQSSLYFRNRNPCAEIDPTAFEVAGARTGSGGTGEEAKRNGLSVQRARSTALTERLRGFTPESVGLSPDQLEPQR